MKRLLVLIGVCAVLLLGAGCTSVIEGIHDHEGQIISRSAPRFTNDEKAKEKLREEVRAHEDEVKRADEARDTKRDSPPRASKKRDSGPSFMERAAIMWENFITWSYTWLQECIAEYTPWKLE